jgi:hypothetical protein
MHKLVERLNLRGNSRVRLLRHPSMKLAKKKLQLVDYHWQIPNIYKLHTVI